MEIQEPEAGTTRYRASAAERKLQVNQSIDGVVAVNVRPRQGNPLCIFESEALPDHRIAQS